MKAIKIAPYLLLLIFIPIIAGLLWKASRMYRKPGLSDIGRSYDYPYSRYSNGNGKIYYLQVGLGYFQVDQADAATFQALNTVNDRGTIGKDARHVFYKTKIIPAVNPADVVYLGNNYFKAAQSVYYGNMILRSADGFSFKFIKDFYSQDNQHIYFKQNQVIGADVKTLDSVKNSRLPYEYIADQRHVFYNGAMINGARPAEFTMLEVADDQWHTQYAFDGQNYFFENHQILMHREPQKNGLKLLSLDKRFTWHGIFYQGKSIYCYDTQSDQLVKLGERDNSTPFSQIDRGIFTDGKHIYFTFTKWNKAGGRMPHYTGHTTGICVAENTDPANFKAAGSFTDPKDGMEGTRYRSGSYNFFHPITTPVGNYSAGLMELKPDGTTEKLPTGDALSKYLKTDNGPSVFSWQFYKDLFRVDTVSDDL